MTPVSYGQFQDVFVPMSRTKANRLRDSMLSPEEKQERKKLLGEFQMLKTAAIIACFISGAVFAMFPNLFVGCLSAAILYVAYEVGTVATNVQKILEDFNIEDRINSNDQALLREIA